MTADPTIDIDLDGNRGRFVARRGDDELGEMTFSRAGDTMIMVDHTEVDEAARGGQVGEKLFDAMVAWARAQSVRVIPVCPFAAAQFKRHPETRDVL